MISLSTPFALLRKQKLFARSNFFCCQGCGCNAMSHRQKEETDNPHKGYVFFHNQDNERRVKGKDFYLAYGEFDNQNTTAEQIGKMICQLLLEINSNNLPHPTKGLTVGS